MLVCVRRFQMSEPEPIKNNEDNSKGLGSLAALAQNPQFRTRLELASRIGAILAIFLYFSGFLVVTFANASHGIVSFGLFRAKVLAAGILFSVFMVLPLLEWSRVFEKFGSPKLGEQVIKQTIVPQPRARFYFMVTRLLMFFVTSFAMALLLCFYVLHCEPEWQYLPAILGFMAFAAAVMVFCGLQFAKRPVACAVLCLLIIGVGIAGLILLRERSVGLLVVWFFLVGYCAHYIEKVFREAAHWSYVSWHWVLLYVMGAVAFFGILLYPKVAPSLGGGKPMRVVFQFYNSSPIDHSTKEQLWMVDEIDAGYYVMQSSDERKAVFLPRSLVSAIYFDADESATQSHSDSAHKMGTGK